MRAFAYKNTKTAAGLYDRVNSDYPRGYAYETAMHFVHIYGEGDHAWTLSAWPTVTEQRNGTLKEWVERTFGAVEIVQTKLEVGSTIKGVWRPGLCKDSEIEQGLSITKEEPRLSEHALLLLIQRLDEIFLFIEPSPTALDSFGHKARELLILACTEVENYWKHYMRLAGATPSGRDFRTSDYVKLRDILYLEDYEVSLARYSGVPAVKPFMGWSDAAPTQSLPWYDAYNKTKHDRAMHFSEATLRHCISAVSAVLTLFSARFGPYRLFNGGGTLSATINQSFMLRLAKCDPASVYVPKYAISPTEIKPLSYFSADDLSEPRTVHPFRLSP